MSGETDLKMLLRNMQPELVPGEFLFCTTSKSLREIFKEHDVNPVAMTQEREGTSLILLRDEAEKAGFKGIYPCRMITLNIHSALDAKGFIAKITNELARHKISVNPNSAYYHDHLFVPADEADRTMELLSALTRE